MAYYEISNNPELLGLLDMRPNIVFAAPEGHELALQLVKPQWSSGGQGFPLVVFIQGSAWQKPNQFWEIPQLCGLVKQGYVVASVTHRSCWESPAPAFLQDVKAALRFLRTHAADYDVDPQRVGVWGTSSGGNTALLLGVTGDDPAYDPPEYPGVSTKVKVVVDCFGPTDLVRMAEERMGSQPLDGKNLFLALGGGDPAKALDRLATISPLRLLKPGMALPPFLLLNGDADELVEYGESQRMYDKLTALGYEADLVRVKGAPHEGNFWSPEVLEMIFGFIKKHL